MTADPDDVRTIAAIVAQIRPLLAGHKPEVQGAVLADLLSIWLAGHPADMRDSALEIHVRFVRNLIPASERQLFGERGHPHNTPRGIN